MTQCRGSERSPHHNHYTNLFTFLIMAFQASKLLKRATTITTGLSFCKQMSRQKLPHIDNGRPYDITGYAVALSKIQILHSNESMGG